MKLSQYNIIEKNGENTIICNTVTSAILVLNEEYSNAFQELEVTGNTSKEDLVQALIKGKILIDDNCNELKELLVKNTIARFNSEVLVLTVAPTLACNFCCPYCYEQGKEYTCMNEENVDDIIKFIKKYFPKIKCLSLAWYGGEPLLVIDLIEKITNKIRDSLDPNCEYHASMVTNGYGLNRSMAGRLKGLGIDHIQVTLDGSKKSHDSRRILHNGEGTFERIIENIKDSCEEISINIRANIDKSNISDAIEILDWFDKYNLKDKISFYLAPVRDINDICNKSTCMSMGEFSEEEIKFYKLSLERGYNYIRMPRPNIGICGAVSLNSFVIDPRGDLYKCWNDVGDSLKKVGNITDNLRLDEKLADWLLYNPVIDNECKTCSVFPICFGGCPDNIIKGKDKSCKSIKWNGGEMIKILNKIKEQSK